MKKALFALLLLGCTGAREPGLTPEQQAVMALEAKLTGTWKLTDYTPEQPLSLAMLLGMQKDNVVVMFQGGHMRSATPALQFDRRYRLEPPIGDTFRVFISDEQGIEYESWARFGQPNQIWFETKTDPWKGRGTLDRVVN